MSTTTDHQESQPPLTADCPLSAAEQTNNLLRFGLNVGLIYLVAPVLYVGIAQAALFKSLCASDTVANLPASMYLWTTPLPVLVAWYFPAVRLLRPMLYLAYVLSACVGVLVVVALLSESPRLVIGAVLLHAAVLGCTNGVVAVCQWEVLGRGVTERRRGQAFSLAYGFGPLLAVVGSLGSQLILDGKLGPLILNELEYPWTWVLLYGATVPVMALAAWSSLGFIVPQPLQEVERKPFWPEMVGGFKEFFGYRLILIAAVAYILVYSGGNMILQNISLYTRDVLGEEPEKYAGYQLALRFSFKVVSGFILGWLITVTHPKAALLFTTSLCLAGVVWAMEVPGKWYLVSFGILGAGELMGAYYPYYILCCSAKSRIRRNMAYCSMITMPVGLAGIMFGGISDFFGKRHGSAFGLRLSFLVAIIMLAGTLLWVMLTLPNRPGPRECDMDESDREPIVKGKADGN
jgi:hypothetical protein